ncbi:hypothetical protein AXG93_2841s1180 [Marchantia polymorpha subsp. ruderalis]|uniref:Uncharacterized protein n=1 Tax=Marchantia polymorpha subsp. ruderalis TaxID=1480154 RepID=A0A176WRW6_MARPO|nr:hypothetical protein AXG93_2841s1180 [Marchantia polymorpha subsp. ruderalis]
MNDFSISSSQAKYDVVEDVGSQKANITVGQLIALNPAIRKELRGGLPEVAGLSSTRTKKRRSKEKAHMTNVGVGVVNAAALEIVDEVGDATFQTFEYNCWSTSDQETSSDDSSNDDLQVQVVAAMELLPRPGVKKDPDKVEMSEEEVCRRLSTLKFGPNVTMEEKARFLDIFRKYIHVFAFSYKDLKHVTLETHHIELEEKARPIRQKQRQINSPTAVVVKEEIDKLRKAGFIYEVENSEWVSPNQVKSI